MCVVSMVSDHYFQKYQYPTQWTWPTWTEYMELKRKAELYDELTKQKDCFKDDLSDKEKAVIEYLRRMADVK